MVPSRSVRRNDLRGNDAVPFGQFRPVAVIPEGSVIRIPAGIPHSPRRAPDTLTFVLERNGRESEIDRFRWFCQRHQKISWPFSLPQHYFFFPGASSGLE